MLLISRVISLSVMVITIHMWAVKASLATHVDWRKQGLVIPVKNQGKCNSGWAFAATGAVEGQHKKKTSKLVSLSEQNLIDCSDEEGNRGCEHGLADSAFEYIIRNGGIDTEQSYPYKAKKGSCHFSERSVGAVCTGYVNIPSGDEEALTKAVAKVGPISAIIDASHNSFKNYTNGIYYEQDCSSLSLNHGVLVIGYGKENGQEYWLVKNSYGTDWGEKGYIRMARNKDNNCGIATQASYPLV